MLEGEDQILFLVDVIQRFSELKDYRRSNISLSQFKIKTVLSEVEKRLSLLPGEIYFLDADEIVDALKHSSVDPGLIAARKNETVMIFKKDKVITLEVDEKLRNTIKAIEDDYFQGTKIRGFSACRGNHTGIVKIIDDARDMYKMKKGDVLVSKMTTPDILMAIKESGAIVTDEGGLTCHAAIVSREFGIPCIIGTRIASRILKDGDLVEVDADKGVVKIIRKK